MPAPGPVPSCPLQLKSCRTVKVSCCGGGDGVAAGGCVGWVTGASAACEDLPLPQSAVVSANNVAIMMARIALTIVMASPFSAGNHTRQGLRLEGIVTS